MEGTFGPNFELINSILKAYSICCRLDGLFHHYLNEIMVKRHKRDGLTAFHNDGQGDSFEVVYHLGRPF